MGGVGWEGVVGWEGWRAGGRDRRQGQREIGWEGTMKGGRDGGR